MQGLKAPVLTEEQAAPKYNIAPTNKTFIVREYEDQELHDVVRESPDTSERELVRLRWGLIPKWAPDTRKPMMNARAETAASKPTFRDSMKYRRCLVATDRWYESMELPGSTERKPLKQRIFIRRLGPDGNPVPFFFAGLWSVWRPKEEPNATPLETFAIVTREPSPALRVVHDRIPVVLPEELYDSWLDRKMTDANAAAALLEFAVMGGFDFHKVSTKSNFAKNEGPDCMEPIK